MKQPNILIIHCHDLGQHLGCYGIESVNTPNIDAFSRNGHLFRNAFATAPQCSPSRASMYTGTYPEENGVMGLCNAIMEWDLKPDIPHIGQILREAGYFTFGAGVIHETMSGPQRCGLDHYIKNQSAGQLAESFPGLIMKAKEEQRPFYGQVGFFPPHRRPLDWSDKKEDQGFLESGMEPDDSLGIKVPGYLADTPGTREELAELQGAIRAVDEAFGSMLKCLEENGLRENTILIFTTDHGIAMPRGKCTLFDPGIEIAMMLQWPGGLPEHKTIDALYSNVDLTPTLLDLAGLNIPQHMSGRSWKPFLMGQQTPVRDEVFSSMTFHDYYFPMRSVRTDRYKMIVHFSNTHAFMDPTQSWHHRSETLVPPNNNRSKSPLVELYDVDEDPWEHNNLADSDAHFPVRDDLLERLAGHMRSVKDPLPDKGFPSPRHVKACSLLGFK